MKDVLLGVIDGAKIASFIYAALLCLDYAGKHLDKKHVKWYKVILLFIPVSVMVGQYEEFERMRGAPTAYLIAFFATFILGAACIVGVALDLYYRRENK